MTYSHEHPKDSPLPRSLILSAQPLPSLCWKQLQVPNYKVIHNFFQALQIIYSRSSQFFIIHMCVHPGLPGSLAHRNMQAHTLVPLCLHSQLSKGIDWHTPIYSAAGFLQSKLINQKSDKTATTNPT